MKLAAANQYSIFNICVSVFNATTWSLSMVLSSNSEDMAGPNPPDNYLINIILVKE